MSDSVSQVPKRADREQVPSGIHTRLGLAVALILLLAGEPLALAQNHAGSPTGRNWVRVKGLPDLPGSAYDSTARSVSADGRVVAGVGISEQSYGGSHSDYEGVRWKDGITTALGDLPGSDYASHARGVSADGTWIVGSSRGKKSGWRWGQWRACAWGPSGALLELVDLPGVDEESTNALAASADGSVIVGSSAGTATENRTIAVRWTGGAAHALGWLPTNNETRAVDVSNDGQVIVGNATGGAAADRAFRWTESSGMIDLGENTSAISITADGTYVLGKVAGGDVGRWSAAAGWEVLDDSFTPMAISADGQVVVGTSNGAGFSFAVLWTAAGGARHLIDVIQEEWGQDVGGWAFKSAWDVSADGTVIVGHGINPSGQKEAYKVVLPRETWSDLGQALAGTKGEPVLRGTGSMQPGSTFELDLRSARNSTLAVLMVGSTPLGQPFRGGTLLLLPDFLLLGSTGQLGTRTVGTIWPEGVPSGSDLFFQYWLVDPAGPQGFAASNGLRARVP